MTKKSPLKRLEGLFNSYMIISGLLAILMIIVGLILYFSPAFAMRTVSWLVGLFFIIQGALAVISYIKKERVSLLNLNLVYGIISILIGIFVITNPFAIANFLTIGLGIWLIISGGLKVNYGLRLKNIKESSWALTFGVGIISIIFGLLAILNPFSKLFLIEVIGLFLLVYGIIDLTDIILLKKRSKVFIKLFK